MNEEHHSHIGKYLAVFGTLMVLTATTVGIAQLHMGILAAVGVAMLVAATKGGLVAAYFMHLVGEHKWVYLVLILTLIFFVFLLFVPTLVSQTDYRLPK